MCLRRENHRHVFALKFGGTLDGHDFFQSFGEFVEDFAAQFGMRQFSAAKHYRHFDFVALFDKALGVFEFDFKVVLFDVGAKFDFFDRDDLLLLANFFFAFLLP